MTPRAPIVPRAPIIPSFPSERAETAWWDKNRTIVEAHLRSVLRDNAKAPAKEVMTRGYKKKFIPVVVRLTGDDLDAARKIAEYRGIAYDSYIALLLAR